jgi:hypothetical protein
MKNKLLIVFLFFIFHSESKAQFYDAGQDPAIIEWKQIDTSFFKLIFPSSFENQAKELANYLYYSNKYNTYSLKRKPAKIPIVLHNQTIVSNGFVTWAPKRSEWYVCPSQDIYAQPWLQQLAIHEYRHVVQVSQMYQGLSKILYIPFGQMGIGSVAGVFLPRWFLEGDAVVMETAITKSGRGRIPDFSMDMKAQLLEIGKFSYNKSMFGSYKNHVPDPYTMGYQLVANARTKYGSDIWDKTLTYVSRNPFIGVPFAQGFKKYTKKTPLQHYYETLESLDTLWEQNRANKKFSLIKNKILIKDKFYTDYRFPHYINDSELVVLKTGLDDIDRIVKIDSKGKCITLHTPGNLTTNSISYSNNKVVWSEQIPDLRWSLKNYSVVKVFDLLTKQTQQISSKSRYFVPSLSSDATKSVVVEIDELNNCSLLIISILDGKIVKKISSPDNLLLTYPTFDDNDEKIISVAIGSNGKALIEYQISTNSFHQITPFDYQEISAPSYFRNFIIYNGIQDETTEIIAYDTITKSKYQLTTSKYGATDFSVSGNERELLYSNYSSEGFKTVSAELNQNLWIKIKQHNSNKFKTADLLAKQERGIIVYDSIENKNFEIKKYSKIKHLLNFHSWAPLSIDANNQSVVPGVSFMSHNLLSTAFITTGYEYLSSEKTGKYFFDFTYKGWFPIIETRIEFKERNAILIKVDNTRVPFTFGETNIKVLVRVPLKFSTGKYYTGIQPSVGSTLINISHNSSTPDIFMKGNINSIDYRLYAYHFLKMSKRDLFPKWGQTLEINYRHSPFGIRNIGNIASAESYLYFPSIIRHHGFIAYTAYQKRMFGNGNYGYSDLISYPLGHYTVENENFISASLKYYFPLLYPDLSLSSLIYLKRLDMNVFYGKAKANYLGAESYLQSVGSEINSEMHILRFVAPINLGYRFVYLPDQESFYNEILFGINFSSIGKK